jgi:hypothetical protein
MEKTWFKQSYFDYIFTYQYFFQCINTDNDHFVLWYNNIAMLYLKIY